jgi:hypothetical protein
VYVKIPERKRPLARREYRCENNIKVTYRTAECELIWFRKGSSEGFCECGKEFSIFEGTGCV